MGNNFTLLCLIHRVVHREEDVLRRAVNVGIKNHYTLPGSLQRPRQVCGNGAFTNAAFSGRNGDHGFVSPKS
jgi:hypothetical protein